jgi:hypothetical protein
VSALDVLIRRLMSQRASLERAAATITQLPGPALMIGWGGGAAYDHLREIMRRRDIIVFDQDIDAPEDQPPAAEFRIVGDPRDTLPLAWERLRREAALACLNFPAATRLAVELAPLLAPLMRVGALVVSEAPLELPGWQSVAAPENQRSDYLYRVS